MPKAWDELIKALTLLARGQNNEISPLHCDHDRLFVSADPKAFTPEEIEQLDEWGFFELDDSFYSYRYGSA